MAGSGRVKRATFNMEQRRPNTLGKFRFNPSRIPRWYSLDFVYLYGLEIIMKLMKY